LRQGQRGSTSVLGVLLDEGQESGQSAVALVEHRQRYRAPEPVDDRHGDGRGARAGPGPVGGDAGEGQGAGGAGREGDGVGGRDRSEGAATRSLHVRNSIQTTVDGRHFCQDDITLNHGESSRPGPVRFLPLHLSEGI